MDLPGPCSWIRLLLPQTPPQQLWHHPTQLRHCPHLPLGVTVSLNLSYTPVFTGDQGGVLQNGMRVGKPQLREQVGQCSHPGRSKCRNQAVTKSAWVDLNWNQRCETYQGHVLLRTVGSRKLVSSGLSENSNLLC